MFLAFALLLAQEPTVYRHYDDHKPRGPYIVFVGSPPRTVKGLDACWHAKLDGAPKGSVVVSDGRYWLKTLPATATDTEIRQAAGLERPAMAAPFSDQAAIADAEDALAAVNAARAARGLRPYLRDDGLMAAAKSAAEFRASHRLAGHTSNELGFLPPGSRSMASGCAAWPVGSGWGSCRTLEGWTHAGAGWTIGPDGLRYMHLFVR